MERGKRRRGEGVGGVRDLLGGLGDILDLIARLADEGGEMTQTREVRGPGETRAVYGFSIKVGLGGQPVVERFGNVRPSPRGPVVEEVREPPVDVLEEGDMLRVIAEMPGADEQAIEVDVKGGVMHIKAGGPRKYRKELELPGPVEPGSLVTSYRNGILEIRLRKV